MSTINDALDQWSRDLILDLPPLDGEDEEEEAAGELDVELEAFDDGEDPFDDAASEEIFDPNSEIDFAAMSDAGEDDDRETDIGEIVIDELGDDEGEGDAAAESWELSEAELGFEVEFTSSDDDGGEEGTLDPSDAWMLDQPLPQLDADDDGDDMGEALFVDELDSLASYEEDLPAWSDIAWEQKSLVLASLEKSGELLSLAVGARRSAAVSARGELFLSNDGGETFEKIEEGGELRGARLAEVAAAEEGPLYLLTSLGELFVRRDGESEPLRSSPSGLLAIAAAKGEIRAISADPERGLELLESDDAGASWSSRELVGAALVVASAPNPRLAATEGAFCMGSEAGLVMARGDGELTLIPGCSGTVALAFAGEGANAPLIAAVYREMENRTVLIRVNAEGVAELVADLGPGDAMDDEDELATAPNALAWDAGRELLWVAGPLGVTAVAA